MQKCPDSLLSQRDTLKKKKKKMPSLAVAVDWYPDLNQIGDSFDYFVAKLLRKRRAKD